MANGKIKNSQPTKSRQTPRPPNDSLSRLQNYGPSNNQILTEHSEQHHKKSHSRLITSLLNSWTDLLTSFPSPQNVTNSSWNTIFGYFIRRTNKWKRQQAKEKKSLSYYFSTYRYLKNMLLSIRFLFVILLLKSCR